MPNAIAALAAQEGIKTVGNLVDTGMGLLLEKHNDARQIRMQQQLQDMQISGNKQMMDYAMQNQLKMWEATNYKAQMEQLKKAGLNPALLYGMGGGGGATVGGGGGGNVGSGSAPVGGGEIMGMMMAKANMELLEAQTRKTNVEAKKIAGADTANVNADTALKAADKIIKEQLGIDATNINDLKWNAFRNATEEQFVSDLQAKNGVASVIVDLYNSGKLKEKSISEIEQLALQNSKTKEETRRITKEIDMIEANLKGQNLGNKLSELELELQKRVGIDRNSPYWLKTLGRWFADLAGPKTP